MSILQLYVLPTGRTYLIDKTWLILDTTHAEFGHWTLVRSVKHAAEGSTEDERGESYKVFNERPLSEDIVRYCIQDVHFLPRLWAHYNGRLTPTWRRRVELGPIERVTQSQSANYRPHGRQKALAPTGWGTL